MGISTKHLAPIGIVLFIYILWKIGISSIIAVFFKINLVYLVPATFFLIPIVLLKGLKWKVVLEAHEESCSLREICKIWLIGLFSGVITPARAGDVIKAFYFKNVPRALSSVIIDRITDIFALFSFGLVGILTTVFLFGSGVTIFLSFLGGFLILLTAVYAFTNRKIVRKSFKPIFNFFVPERQKQKIKLNFHSFYNNIEFIKSNRKQKMLLVFSLALFAWLASFFQAYLIAISLNIPISYFYLVIFLPLGALIQLIPITVSGLGTREATLIFLFSLLGIPAQDVVVFSLLLLFISTILPATVGLFLFLKNPVKIRF
jgi:hypothetical protein